MRVVLAIGTAVLATACSEYDVVDDYPPVGDPNPPGLEEVVQVDKTVQSTVASVDVLWVVDNSGSMSDEQARLAANFGAFMDWFLGSGLDYHIGVVTTDMTADTEQGRLQPGGPNEQYLYIDPTTPDPVGVFQSMALIGIYGDSNERGRDAVHAAIDAHADSENFGFYREDASLAVVVISDEDDYSAMNLNDFIAWFVGLKADREMLSFSSIVGPETSCLGSSGTGYDYLAVTREVGGVEWSICDQDWSPALDQLGMEAAGLRSEFFLTQLPVIDTIHAWVEVDGEMVHDLVMGDDYVYSAERNSIRLETLTPEPLAEVFVEYEIRREAWPAD